MANLRMANADTRPGRILRRNDAASDAARDCRRAENIVSVREKLICNAQLTGKKEDYDRVVEMEKALYICQAYLRQIADFIDEIRDRAFDKRGKL